MKCIYDPAVDCIYEDFSEEKCKRCPIYEQLLRVLRGVVVLSSEIDRAKELVERWFNKYKEIADEAAVELFSDDIEIIDSWANSMLMAGRITNEEYWHLITFCEEKLEELKRLAGVESLDMRFK